LKQQLEVTRVEDIPMYAIFESGGKQYEAKPGAVIRLERLPGAVGDEVILDQVLLVSDGEQVQVGQPLVENLTIQGRIVEQGRLRKILIFKSKRRKDYRKKQGHRQYFTGVRIEAIGNQAQEAPQAAPEPEAAEA
jgi:large subunit ribosomal protein L21